MSLPAAPETAVRAGPECAAVAVRSWESTSRSILGRWPNAGSAKSARPRYAWKGRNHERGGANRVACSGWLEAGGRAAHEGGMENDRAARRNLEGDIGQRVAGRFGYNRFVAQKHVEPSFR